MYRSSSKKLGDKISICVFIWGFHNGGVEKVFENFFTRMDKSKFDLHIVTHMDEYTEREKYFEEMGFQIHHLSPVHVIRITLKNILEYHDLFKKHNFDIVHNNFPEKILPLYMAKKFNVPVRVLHSHNDYSVLAQRCTAFVRPIYKKIIKINAEKYATNCIGCGVYAANSVFGKQKMDLDGNFILYNAIDTEKFKYDINMRKKIREKLGFENDFVIGHVGRYEGKAKNQEFLIDVFNTLLKYEKDAKLLLIGDGENRKSIADKVRHLGIENEVIFTGAINNVADYLQAMDCFVFPSLHEGFSIVTVEAQCTGLRGVISDSLDPEMNITGQFTALSLEKGPEKWAECILNIKGYDRSDKSEELVLAGYDIGYEAKRLERFYESVVKSNYKIDYGV